MHTLILWYINNAFKKYVFVIAPTPSVDEVVLFVD